MSKVFLAGSFAALLCATLAAQAPQTPSPNPSAPPLSQPRTGGDTPQAPTPAPPQTSARAASKADSIVVEGCIQRGASASATAGATGTSGSASSDFILASVAKPSGTAGSSASSSSAPIASSYRLDADASKLTPHVGHKVEISGTVESESASASSSSSASASSASASSSPKLKVDNVRMIAATCTP